MKKLYGRIGHIYTIRRKIGRIYLIKRGDISGCESKAQNHQ